MIEKNNDQLPQNMLEVKVHPHVLGGVKQTLDSQGNKIVVTSALVNMYDRPLKPEFGQPLTVEKVFDVIYNKIAAIGLFSSRFVNVDEFTNINYEEDSTNLISQQIECAESIDIYYPHNRITHHTSNEWIFQTFQILFYLEKGLFPNKYLNLPFIVNIRRSSGNIQKAIIKSNEALRLRKGSQDTEPNVYVKVHFSNKDPEDTREEECIYTKTIYLQEIIDLNSDFKYLEVKRPTDILIDLNQDTEIKRAVIDKTKDDYLGWFFKDFLPLLQSLKGIEVKIKDEI